MELYLNEEKADVIKKYMDLYPLDGITTNPKMIGSLGKVNYADSLRTLRQAVGDPAGGGVHLLNRRKGYLYQGPGQ